LHDIRRTSRSLLSRAGIHRDIAEQVLGHVIPGVAGVYDRHDYVAEKKAALIALETTLAAVLDKPNRLILLESAA
jgi:hypothetical protein